MSNTRISPVVHAIGQMHFEGNIIPQAWYHCPLLRYPDGRANMNAIVLLADILYWYRPAMIRDEQTGDVIGQRQRFRADKLQRSYQAWADAFGMSKGQATDAIAFLVKNGLITREFRTVGTLQNVLFVEPVVKLIEQISPLAPRGCTLGSIDRPPVEGGTRSEDDTLPPPKETPSPDGSIDPPPVEGETYTKTPSETSLETPDETPKSQAVPAAHSTEEQSALFGASELGVAPATKNPPTRQSKTPKSGSSASAAGLPGRDQVLLFKSLYAARWGKEPVLLNFKQAGSQLAEALAAAGDDFEPALTAYVNSDDSFLVGKGHPVGIFCSQLQGWINQSKTGAAPKPRTKPGAGMCGYPEGTDMSLAGMVAHNAARTPAVDAMIAMMRSNPQR